MPMLRDIKIVDLKRSKQDAKKSNPDKAEYVFEPGAKKYVDKSAMIADNACFSWCQYNPRDGMRMLNEWKVKYGYEPVKHSVDPYWPEGAQKNALGYWQYGDLVLVKAPLDKEMERRRFDVEMSGANKKAGEAAKDRLRAFAKGINAIEPGAGVDPDEMEHLLGK
jgi:hypothetical protein